MDRGVSQAECRWCGLPVGNLVKRMGDDLFHHVCYREFGEMMQINRKCDAGHEPIQYSGDRCPLCRVLQLAEVS